MPREKSYAWAGGLALGAFAMYFLDPRYGERRRKGLSAALTTLRPRMEEHGSVDLAAAPALSASPHRALSVAETPLGSLDLEPVPDEVLEASVRATLEQLASHPEQIACVAQDGVLTLGGVLPEREVGQIVTGLRGLRGLRRVDCQFRTLKILPVKRRPRAKGGERGTKPPTPLRRAGLAGTALLLTCLGLRRGGTTGMLSAVAGGALLVRAMSDIQPARIVAATERPVVMDEAVEVEAPVARVFGFWSQFRNFPSFMRHVREVRETEAGISHWVVDGPAGLPVSWDAEVTGLERFRRIAWRSVGDSALRNAGEVLFEELGEDRCRVHVHMISHLPAGNVGQAVSSFFGADPQRELREDLSRFKELLERAPDPPLSASSLARH